MYKLTKSLFTSASVVLSALLISLVAHSQDLEVVSTNAAGQLININSTRPFISGNGRFVAFVSADLLPEAPLFFQVFVRDLETGQLELISANADGEGGNSASNLPASSNARAISDDGRYVLFSSSATDLVPGGNPGGLPMLFLRDRENQTTTMVSVDSDGTPANGAVSYFTLAPQGTGAGGAVIGFNAFADNLDPLDSDGNSDTFIHETVLGRTRLACFDLSGNKIAGGCQGFSLSCAGGAIAFRTNQQNVSVGDANGVTDIYVGLPFIGDAHTLLTIDTFDVPSNVDTTSSPSISCDGRRIAFSTNYSILNNDPFNTPDTYVRNQVTDEVYRILDSNNNAIPSVPSFSSSGSWLAMETPVSVDPLDGGFFDIYLLDFTHQLPGSITLISQNNGASSNSGAVFGVVSDFGSVAFSSTSSNLAPIPDNNNSSDVFVSRALIIFSDGFDGN